MRLTICFSTALLIGRSVAAQSPDTSRTDSAAIAPKPVALEEVRVTAPAVQHSYTATRSRTATRTDTPLRDAPQSISVVTRSLIADQAMTSMSDVVRYIPGVTMGQGEGHRDAPTIRGNSTTADFFVDGVRDDAQYLRDVYNVERIEALKGPNAMVFGRGGGGGVINRVTKEAGTATRDVVVESGSFGHRRSSLDLGFTSAPGSGGRLNGVYENSGSFRDRVRLERYGVNPTATLALGRRTLARLGYEYFVDTRAVDRGVPSFLGRPIAVPVATFFGNPALSQSEATVRSGSLTLEHAARNRVVVRNATRYARYDKFYQNVFPGAVSAGGARVALSAYSNATDRANLFNQTDLTYSVRSGPVWHTLLVGAEMGRQQTGNYRQTGYFTGGRTLDTVTVASPTVGAPVEFRQSATDANNDVHTTVVAVYAQDQLALTAHWQAILGVRYERFSLAVRNHRDATRLHRNDVMVSPRAGLVFKPREPVSLYASYAISHLPSAGDQFSTLTVTTQGLAPERFTNYEIGAKWDVRPALALTSAIYRLDRTNTSAKDPLDPSRTVQTGAQRTAGFEIGLAGAPTRRWQVVAGYASQRAIIGSATAAARAGATVPLVPHQTLSLWNRFDIADALGLAVGIVDQEKSYAAIDNAVVLPRFTRLDAALFTKVLGHVRAQVNVENVANARYYPTSHGNNNILPGAPRTLRVSLATGF